MLVSVKATRPLLALTRALNVTQESYRLEVVLDPRLVVLAAGFALAVAPVAATADRARLPDTTRPDAANSEITRGMPARLPI